MTEEQVVTPPETISDVFSQDTQNSDSNELVTDAPFDEASVFGGFDRVNTTPEEPVENTTAPQEEVLILGVMKWMSTIGCIQSTIWH
jgi:hypothetical protein